MFYKVNKLLKRKISGKPNFKLGLVKLAHFTRKFQSLNVILNLNSMIRSVKAKYFCCYYFLIGILYDNFSFI